jgi:hypothetical protein
VKSEKELRRPLADEEIRTGVAVKVAEAAYNVVYDAVIARMVASGGRLYGTAYPSFKGSGTLHLEYFLDWRGDVVPADEHREKVIDNHPFVFADGEPRSEGELVEVAVNIPETPPNVFRKETGQPIPVASTQNGKTTEKRVRYVPRRK